MEERNKMPLFIIDSSVLSKMIEGSNDGKAKEMMEMLSKMKVAGMPFKALTTLSSLHNAIWKADGNCKLEGLHNVMNTIEILPDKADYKNDKAVMNNIIKIANVLSS